MITNCENTTITTTIYRNYYLLLVNYGLLFYNHYHYTYIMLIKILNYIVI